VVDADAAPATAKDTPAIPKAGTVLLRRFPFEARFTSDIAELLLYFPSTKSASKVLHPLALFCDATVLQRVLKHRFSFGRDAAKIAGRAPRRTRPSQYGPEG
jgi:hypothetical protein